MKFLNAILILFLISCSVKKNIQTNQKKFGHHELYSMPKNIYSEKLPSHLKRIVIVSTNDLQGEIESRQETISKNNKTYTFEVGGNQYIEKYIQILKKNIGEKNLLLVDGGNSYFGFSSKSFSQYLLINNYFEKLNYHYRTISYNDFKLEDSPEKSQHTLMQLLSNSKSNFILSNLIDISTGDFVKWPKIKPFDIKEINGIKVGIISAISSNIISLLPENTFNRLYIGPIETALLKYSRILKAQGAQIILAMIQADQDCSTTLAGRYDLPVDKVNFDPYALDACSLENELAKTLEKLPKNTIHAVIASAKGQKIANFIHGIPVMSNFGNGKYFSIMDFYYDFANEKIDHEKTAIHQPIKFCHEFIKDTMDCYVNDSSVNIENKIPAQFLSEEIKIELPAK